MVKGKECKKCGKHFTTGNDRKIYCSNSCKNKAYRERHMIPEPEFLRPKPKKAKKRRTIRRNRSLNGIVEDVKPVTVMAEDEELTTVKEKVKISKPHPQHVKYRNKIKTLESQSDIIIAEKNRLLRRFTAIANNNPEIASTLAGAAIGSSSYVLSQGKKEVDYAKAAWFGIFGGAIGYLASALTKKSEYQKANELRGIQTKVSNLDNQLNQLQIAKHQIGVWLKSTPKHQIVIEERERQVVKKKDVFEAPVKKMDLESVKVTVKSDTEFSRPKEVPLSKFQEMKFNTMGFKGRWLDLLGDPQRGFKMLVWGENGNGKSTFSLDFAKYLANGFGHVLYNSSEERLSHSLQKKLLGFKSEFFTITEGKTFNELKELLKNPKYSIIFIDSVNDMMMGYDEFKGLVDTYPQRCFIYIMQVTKDGNFKGDNRFAHLADIKVQVSNYEPILEKSRYL